MTAGPPSGGMGLSDKELYHETLIGDHDDVVIQLVSWPEGLVVRQPGSWSIASEGKGGSWSIASEGRGGMEHY